MHPKIFYREDTQVGRILMDNRNVLALTGINSGMFRQVADGGPLYNSVLMFGRGGKWDFALAIF